MSARVKLEALHLRDRVYAVRPENQLGTCGWYPVAWQVQYVQANSPEDAVAKAKPLYHQGQYDRDPVTGRSIPATDYPPIPEPYKGEFFTGYGYAPARVIYWCWRTDYQQWGALVEFEEAYQHGGPDQFVRRLVTSPRPQPLHSCPTDRATFNDWRNPQN